MAGSPEAEGFSAGASETLSFCGVLPDRSEVTSDSPSERTVCVRVGEELSSSAGSVGTVTVSSTVSDADGEIPGSGAVFSVQDPVGSPVCSDAGEKSLSGSLVRNQAPARMARHRTASPEAVKTTFPDGSFFFIGISFPFHQISFPFIR